MSALQDAGSRVPDVNRHAVHSVRETLADLSSAVPSADVGPVCATGFHPLDDVFGGGLRPGELLVVGGRPGVGKTIVCLQWARTIATRGVPVVYACYEHDPATLLTRLLRIELGELVLESGRHIEHEVEELQSRLSDAASGLLPLGDVIASDALLTEAAQRVERYADHLMILGASGATTGLSSLRAAVSDLGRPAVLFVDYLQKVPVTTPVESEDDRITIVMQGLKDLALVCEIPVFAVSSASHAGLVAPRMRAHHLRGAAGVVYESDVIVLLNEKLTVVSRAHIAFAPIRVEEFSRQVVFSVEKNRGGVSGVDLEFTKQFVHYRFDPYGRWVNEHLRGEYGVDS